MKPILSILLMMLLGSCYYQPATTKAIELGNKLNKCCTSLVRVNYSVKPGSVSIIEESTICPDKPVSILEKGSQLLTW